MSDHQVLVELDRSLVFMLSNIAGTSLKETAAEIMSQANISLDRLKARGVDARGSRTTICFPNTTIKIVLSVTKSVDEKQIKKDRRHVMKQLNIKSNHKLILTPYHRDDLWCDLPPCDLEPHVEKWFYDNIKVWPNAEESKYLIYKIKATLAANIRTLSFTKDDLDNFMIEQLLLKSGNQEE